MVLTQLNDSLLLPGKLLGLKDFLHPPLVAGSSAEHTSHEMEMSVRMVKGMKGIVAVHLKALTGNKDGSAGTQGNVAASLANGSCSNSGSGIVPCAGNDFYIL